ncbi:MAG: hypothetical protein ACSHWN_10100 [Methylophilaceae bacterium]
MNIDKHIQAINNFQGDSLTKSISNLEQQVKGLGAEEMHKLCESVQINQDFISSTSAIKKAAAQINVIIHATGILMSLQNILEDNEVVESVSLGAGNTGRKFDLETNLRVAEYKFIDWQAGPNAIRQNSVFQDFFTLAEHETNKKKYLYVVDDAPSLKFLNSGRALTSVLFRHTRIHQAIINKYGENIEKVRDYYNLKKDEVEICDIRPFLV